MKNKVDYLHPTLANKFPTPNVFKNECEIEPYLLAIDKDLTRLIECKREIELLKYEYKIQLNSIYATKIKELHTEMRLWRKLLIQFPKWAKDNTSQDHFSLIEWFKKLFNSK